MKILQLCKKFPYPLNDGESIAVSYLSMAMNQLGCEVTLLCMNTSKHYTDVDNLPSEYNFYNEIIVTDLDNSLNAVDAFKNLFSKDSYHVSRFVCDKYEEELVKLLKSTKFDIVQLETLYLAPYIDCIRKHSDALITMRAHNVEHEIWERISENTKFLPKRWYLRYLTKKLKRFELDMLKEYDYLVAVSEKDLQNFKQLGYANGAVASPIGINVSKYESKEVNVDQLSLGFIGSLDWLPNSEGVDWFLENVWDRVNALFPDLVLEIAGRNQPARYSKITYSNVHIIGEVESAIDFINSHPIMIVPLLSGSGMRVKILEGMALGRIIITTSLGLEGIHAEHKKHVLVADTPDDFIRCIQYCYDNKDLLSKMSKNAYKFVSEYFDYHKNAKDLKELYSHILVKYNNQKIVG